MEIINFDDLYIDYKNRLGRLNDKEGVAAILPVQERLAIESFIDYCKYCKKEKKKDPIIK